MRRSGGRVCVKKTKFINHQYHRKAKFIIASAPGRGSTIPVHIYRLLVVHYSAHRFALYYHVTMCQTDDSSCWVG